ncbi:unnamed protein product [Phaeothamnion confervicola]
MAAFHMAWFGFCMAFTAWFSFSPLMPEIKKSLGLTKVEVYNANIASISATIGARFIIGPLCDSVGARTIQTVILVLGGISTYFGAIVNNATDLAVVRFFVGILGATFVSTMYWTSAHFAKEVVGAANATAAGWGNFGGGLTHLLMIAIWNMFQNAGYNAEEAWRRSFYIPASIVLVTAVMTYFLAEDSPKGNYKELYKHGSVVRRSSVKSAQSAWGSPTAWCVCCPLLSGTAGLLLGRSFMVLALQYAMSFGMELTLVNFSPLFFSQKWGVSTTKAGLISALFGCMNLFARSLGGFASDAVFKKMGAGAVGMRGRIIVQFSCVLLEGVTLVIFATRDTLNSAVVMLAVFSLFVAMSNGSLYGIVPYVRPNATGATSGVVGAGGNIGALCWSLYFRFGPSDMSRIFETLGYLVMGVAFTTPLIAIRGYDTCFTKAKGEQASLDEI